MTTYRPAPIASIDPALMRDLEHGTNEWAVIRAGSRGDKVWSFHATEALAERACARNRSRDIVTR